MTNCYIFGSDSKIIIIDPGMEPRSIIEAIENLGDLIEVKGVVLTHGHFDHSMKAGRIIKRFNAPLMYSKNDAGRYGINKEADRWLNEGDIINLDAITLHVLETPGHTPGGISLYTRDIKQLDGKKIDGIIFTGDLIFRRSIGRTDFPGGDQRQLFSSIKNKIMFNPEITDNFVVFPGHMGDTTVGEERNQNMFKNYFL
jgi:glyoxylase-like metal-dependent hydrolase (beta-lactamase superfamily II)